MSRNVTSKEESLGESPVKDKEAGCEYTFPNREEYEHALEEARDNEPEAQEQQQEVEDAAEPVNQGRVEREEPTPNR